MEYNDNEYQTPIKVNIWLNAPQELKNQIDYDNSVQATARFTIDVEHRSWGIKDIFVNVTSISTIEIIIMDAETMDDTNPVKVIEAKIDPSQLKTEKHSPENSGITVGDIELNIDYDGNIDYNKSYIQVYSL